MGFSVYTRGLLPVPRVWVIISLSSLPGTNVEAGSLSSLLGLAPGGGCLAAYIAVDAGGLLHRLFTVTSLPERSEAVYFCGPDPAGYPIIGASPSRGFPGTAPCGVRTFLDPVLCTGPRPPGQPEDKGIIPSLTGGVNLIYIKIWTESRPSSKISRLWIGKTLEEASG